MPNDKIMSDDYAERFREKTEKFNCFKQNIMNYYKKTSLYDLSGGCHEYGYNIKRDGVEFKEWFDHRNQGIISVSLIGDFNDWSTESHKMTMNPDGTCSLFLPNVNGKCQIEHLSRLQYYVNKQDQNLKIISAWAKYLTPMIPGQESYNEHNIFELFWNPVDQYKWKHPKSKKRSEVNYAFTNFMSE